MYRDWIVIAKVSDLTEIPPLNRLWYAESNSSDRKPRLSGEPEIREAIEIFLKALPPTYTKEDAVGLANTAIGNVFKDTEQRGKEMAEHKKWTLIDHIMESGFADTTADDWFYELDVKRTVDELKKRIKAMSSQSPPRCTPGFSNELCKEVDEVFGDLNLSFDDILERDNPTKEEE